MRSFFQNEFNSSQPSSKALLNWLSDEVGMKLPDSFESIYLTSNGGDFDEQIIYNSTEPWIAFSMHPNYIGIYEFFSIEEIVDRTQSIKSHCQDYNIDISDANFFLNTMIPFCEVDGYNPLCIVCKGEDVGKIYLVEWYFFHQNQGTIPFPKQLVANSLDDFLNKMKPSQTDETYLKVLDNL